MSHDTIDCLDLESMVALLSNFKVAIYIYQRRGLGENSKKRTP